ncbi:hypothetical protein GRZ55_14130 [Chelativorans sp. ZYF759]|uniref:hypothetical protein n=1 Tax=Chelativorans sp. ZYF759 TaxID=2692213 RepID=UPI00145D9712|nr:hypothetical protein [Chelativorans sp. ZYF759]NMG40382.1 hypothetical protein [Chelativorans sp. ZYF759]
MTARTEHFTPPSLRGGRGTTEALDLSDATDAFEHLHKTTGDATAAALLAGLVLIAEAVRERA